jgi:hypothetical protein
MEHNGYMGSGETAALSVSARSCISCSKQVRGRTDKKFCDDYCRNNYNNHLKAESNNLVRNVNNALGKNRRILEALFSKTEKITKASAAELLESGFHFKYFTHQYTNKKGNTYFFCYDYGYLRLENDYYLLVKKIN